MQASVDVAQVGATPAPSENAIEVARQVQHSALTIESLLHRYRLATLDLNQMIRWAAEVHVWRDDLWTTYAMLIGEGFRVPELDFDADPYLFIATWRLFLAKVWPAVDPFQAPGARQ